jgi:WD40 repeat protein/CHAT domain-containing protein/Tfp pilus assembly protein PilF
MSKSSSRPPPAHNLPPTRMKSINTLEGHGDSVYALSFSADGSTLVSGTRDGTVFLWDVASGKAINVVRPGVGSVNGVAFAADGRMLAAGGPGGAVTYRPPDGQMLARFDEPGIECLAFTPDTKQLLLGTSVGQLRVFDIEGGHRTHQLELSSGPLVSLALSPDGATVAAASGDGAVALVDASTWSVGKTLRLTDHGALYRWLYSPDGGTYGGSLQIRLGGQIGQTFTPDRYEIVLWEPALEPEPDPGRFLFGHLGWIGALDFRGPGRLLASGACDESVRLWNWEDGTLVAESREHKGPVFGVQFSPAGDLLASCSADRTIKLWPVDPVLEDDAVSPVSASDLLREFMEAQGGGRSGVLVVAQDFLDGIWALPALSRHFAGEAVASLRTVFGDASMIVLTAVTFAVQLRLEQALREEDPGAAAFYEDLGSWIRDASMREADLEYVRLNHAPAAAPPPDTKDLPAITEPTPDAAGLASLIDRVADGVLAPDDAVDAARSMGPAEGDMLAARRRVEERMADVLAGRADGRSLTQAAEVLYRLAEPTGRPALLAPASLLAGTLLAMGGDNEAGVVRLEEAVRWARQYGEPRVIAASLGNLANAYRNVGRLRDALDAYQEVLAVAEQHGLSSTLMEHLNNIAIVYEDLGDHVKHGQSLRRAQVQARGLGLDRELATIDSNLGIYLWRTGDYAASISVHTEALAAARRLDDQRLVASALGNLGVVRSASGDAGAARANFHESLEVATRIGDMTVAANAAVGIGKLDIADGRPGDARQILEQAVNLAHDSPPGVLMAALDTLATAQRLSGETEAAIVTLRQAAATGERLRHQVEQPGAAERIQNRLAAVYDRLVTLCVDAGQVEDAFACAVSASGALLSRRLDRGSAWSADTGGSAFTVLAQLRRLGDRAVLVAYHLSGERVLSFVLRADSGGLFVAEGRVEPARLERLLDDFRREVSESPRYGDVGETWLELGQSVIDPVIGLLKDDDVLFVAPHGPLHHLPLHALMAEGKRVIERWPVAYLPTVSVLGALIDDLGRRPGRPLVIGAGFVSEARTVAAQLPGAKTLIGDALDRDEVLDALPAADLVHVSAYGFFSEAEPQRSGWLTRPSKEVMRHLAARAIPSYTRALTDVLAAANQTLPHEGVVSVADLEHLRLRARLVTLSACESGLLRTDSADDPVGLVPTLLACGVPAVVATLWQVDPETTEHFAGELYRLLWRSDADWLRKPQALRLTILELMRTHPQPFYWAPFVLIGGGGPGLADTEVA